MTDSQRSSFSDKAASNRDSKIVVSSFMPSRSALITLLEQIQVHQHASDIFICTVSTTSSPVCLKLVILLSRNLISSLAVTFIVNELLL